MRTLIFALASILLCPILLNAADRDAAPYFTATCTITQSSSTNGCTLQVPERAEKSAYLESVSIYCAQGCTVAQTKNGTTATATLVVPVTLGMTATPVAMAYSSTDSTGGSAMKSLSIPSDTEISINYSYTALWKGQGAAQNITIKPSAAMSGEFTVSFIWYEK